MMKQGQAYIPQKTLPLMLRRTASVLVIMLFFLFGYNGMVANTQACSAQYSIVPAILAKPVLPVAGSACGCFPGAQVPCTVPQSTALLSAAIEESYRLELEASSEVVERYISMAVDTLVQTVFSRLEQMEKDFAAWFDTYWYYNYKPSLQDMTEQANISGMDQAQHVASLTDSDLQNRVRAEHADHAARVSVAHAEVAGDDACAVTTASGGLGSANVFSRAMRRAWQQKFTGDILAREGTPAARGPGAVVAAHADEFENLFCDPRDNGGNNACGASDPEFYNADVQVTGRIFNTLTIPVDKDARHNTAVEHMLTNMVGRPQSRMLGPTAVARGAGKQTWMERRSYAARKNATRTVPELVASWRIPGGGVTGAADGGFIAALRQGAGISLDDLSDNPSYREIIHAMSIDRFNSGVYANDKISSLERQQMEKIILNAIYLMQLRDYYELLERTALTLAVQVSVLSEDYPLGSPPSSADTKGATP